MSRSRLDFLADRDEPERADVQPAARVWGPKVPLPLSAAVLTGAPADEYQALLQEHARLRQDLFEAREREQVAADKGWVEIIEGVLRRGSMPEPIMAVLAEHGVSLMGADGQSVGELPPGTFEVLGSSEPGPGRGEGVVTETCRPAIHRDGRLLRPGKIVITRRGVAEEQL